MNLLAQGVAGITLTKAAAFVFFHGRSRNTSLCCVLVALLFGSTFCTASQGPGLLLTWDALPDSEVAGYHLYMGTESGTYSAMTDAGNATQITLTNLTDGVTYFFVVAGYTADGHEGEFSAEMSLIEPASLDFATIVKPNGHTISKVLFYNGSVLIGESLSAPYNLTWTNVAAGNYALTAQVLYDTNLTAISAVANVSVNTSRLPPPASPTLALSISVGHLPVLEALGTPDHTYEIQATSDFITWTPIGIGTANIDGRFVFTDYRAASVPTRYYRLKDVSTQ
jgi:hypothetical protein